MAIQKKRSIQALMPRYDNNAVVQLIIALGVAYVLAKFTILLLIVYGNKGKAAEQMVYTVTGLPAVYNYGKYWWTLLTYSWMHLSFWAWVSNMIWLFVFGSSFQLLAGKRQIFPVFLLGSLVGGLFYLLAQWLPVSSLHIAAPYLMGAQAGIAGMAFAIIRLSPGYRYFFTEYFFLPIWAMLLIFLVLMMLSVGFSMLGLVWLLGGALAGYGYAMLFQKGYRPEEIFYTPKEKILSWFEPKVAERAKPTSYELAEDDRQKKIDRILEKINQAGYDSLSEREKEYLIKEGSKL